MKSSNARGHAESQETSLSQTAIPSPPGRSGTRTELCAILVKRRQTLDLGKGFAGCPLTVSIDRGFEQFWMGQNKGERALLASQNGKQRKEGGQEKELVSNVVFQCFGKNPPRNQRAKSSVETLL